MSAKDASVEPDIHLLAFAPLLDETSFTASNHRDFILATLEWYHLPVDRVVCLIGDNCATNIATANLFDVPLLGCRSHRLNLAVEAYIARFLSIESEIVGKLMSKLSTLKESGRLRLSTSLRPVKRNATRWIGVSNMFERFERLLPNIDETNQELAEFIPTAAQRNNIRRHKRALCDFKSVTLAMQASNATIADSNALFGSLIEAFPEFNFEAYLGTDASIVHSKSFEKAIIKIQSGFEAQLDSDEKTSIQSLKVQHNNVMSIDDNDDSGLSFAECALKRQRKQQEISAYIDTRFLMPTSNHVERLFSMSNRIFSKTRRRLLPRTLEALVFLKQNRGLWNLALVSVVVNEETIDDENQSDEDEELNF